MQGQIWPCQVRLVCSEFLVFFWLFLWLEPHVTREVAWNLPLWPVQHSRIWSQCGLTWHSLESPSHALWAKCCFNIRTLKKDNAIQRKTHIEHEITWSFKMHWNALSDILVPTFSVTKTPSGTLQKPVSSAAFRFQPITSRNRHHVRCSMAFVSKFLVVTSFATAYYMSFWVSLNVCKYALKKLLHTTRHQFVNIDQYTIDCDKNLITAIISNIWWCAI